MWKSSFFGESLGIKMTATWYTLIQEWEAGKHPSGPQNLRFCDLMDGTQAATIKVLLCRIL